jgi:hypothetical protein
VNLLIPIEHLKALVEVLPFNPDERAALLKRLTYADAAHRAAVLEAIEKLSPGKSEELKRVWSRTSGSAVHFWRVPALDGSNLQSLQRALRKRFDLESAHKDVWIDLPKPRVPKTPHLRCVRLSADELRGSVELYSERFVPYEGDGTRVPSSFPVDFRVDLKAPGGRIAEVYYSSAYARSAIITAIEDLTGQEVPRRKSAGQADFLYPLRFGDADIRALATKLDWNVIKYRFQPPDADSNAGEVIVSGRGSATELQPLDPSGKRAQEAELVPNQGRGYRSVFDHGDGFKEQLRFLFEYDGIHPHVRFVGRPSSPGRRYLLDILREHLRD